MKNRALWMLLFSMLGAVGAASSAQAQEEELESRSLEVSDEVAASLVSEEAATWSEYWDDEAVLESIEPDVEEIPEDGPMESPLSLPGDQEASAVTPQALSLPEAEGSIEGMGESFSPVLSSGTATYSVPIAIPAGRAGVQPTFAIAYSSTGGNSCVGFGWAFEAPYISRQTDRGLPRYHDAAAWTAREDRFFYNGGQELVPVATDAVRALDGAAVPPDYVGWQQYRARVEGAFMRFFRAPGGRTWAVQGADGSLLEFGELDATHLPADFGSPAPALQTEDGAGRGRIFRWYLTRMSDAHGSTVYYRYTESLGESGGADGSRYLRDVHYGSPASCGTGAASPAGSRERRRCTAPLSAYGRRVRFQYETRPDIFSSYTAGWRVDLSQRVFRIIVTSAEGDGSERFMVRRYHFGYAPESTSYHSLLTRVQVEGRPDSFDMGVGARLARPVALAEGAIDATFGFVGPLLPPLTFGYSSGAVTTDTVPGFGGLDGTAITAPASPPHSVDEGFADLFDVNSDGLPDLLVTDPARYRTSTGGPAAGVFFNGFSGDRASPNVPGSFSQAVPVAVPPSRSSSFDLSNLNVVPMDIDGDGRSDLLHMPRFANYGYFLPTRAIDTVVASVSPADQGWRFSYVPVALPTGVTDPRIDLGRDGAHLRAFDVNNDHLVDVVRTTGTVMQTWLNLGWLPGGDGRFGSFTIGPTGTVSLSTAPVESCLLEAGLPTDFEDPEVRLGDMNGDGIQDIVRIRRGRVVYWAGRGEGSWGEGPQACPSGAGSNRYIEMSTPPAELNVELDGLYLQDVNADGTADVVQVRFDAIDVWFNRGGRGFTSRVIARGTPARPAFLAGRIRFADMDGSGTVDVLYGNAGNYQWVDLMGGVRPRMLTTVDNGLGALTTLEYGSSAEEYLRDLREAATCTSPGTTTCRDRFTWSRVEGEADARIAALTGEQVWRSGGAPLVAQVVTAVSTTDRFDRVGREATVTRTEYAYHDGHYEGFEQEFRGFGAADAIARSVGTYDTHPTGVTRSYFHQGRRPNTIATDRLADNPYESLKARVYLTESFDPATGRTLSTGHSTYTARELLTGLDGRHVVFAFASATDELRYDTSLSGGGGTVRTFDSVRFETVSSGAIPTTGVVDRQDSVRERWGGAILLSSRVVRMDNFGHALESRALGRPGTDEVITSHGTPILLTDAEGAWLWRDADSYVTGSLSGSTRFGDSHREYNEVGDLLYTRTAANLTTPAFAFLGEGESAPGWAQTDQEMIASSAFDVWGNALRSCGGADLRFAPDSSCLRYGEVSYDSAFTQFPIAERIAVTSSGPDSVRFLGTAGTWDQGLGLLLTVQDPNAFETEVGYDGFGRVAYVRPPPSNGECGGSRAVPVQHFAYDLTTDPGGRPVSVVTAYQENDCAAIGASTIETRTYVDGLGRARASLTTSENVGEWIQSGISILNSRGSVRRAYQPRRLGSADPSTSLALNIPAVPFEESGYDAFDRVVARFPSVGGLYFTTFHALSRDECDPLDHDRSSPHYRTCTTMRMDGHGRVIDQILRNRQPGLPDVEYYRLFTDYRADNAVTRIVRAQTSSDTNREVAEVLDGHAVERTFTYDTAGRRIGTTDPDSDSDSPSRDASNRTWRYLFNRVGDLVAVRDPRGCGQDFFYDHAARLVAEDYIGCGESAGVDEDAALALPYDAIGLEAVAAGRAIDVVYLFDEVPDFAAAEPEVALSRYRGRLGGVEDRGQRSAMAYDDRGQVVWTVRQMTVIPDAVEPTVSTVDGLPVIVEGPALPWVRTFDEAHAYERTARYDHGGRPTSMTLPLDPDYAGGSAPVIGGELTYNRRGLPGRVALRIGSATPSIVDSLVYTRDGLVEQVTYGDVLDGEGGARPATVSFTTYDDRRRPIRMVTTRTPNAHGELGEERPLADVSSPHDQMLVWDLADNLIAVEDLRDPTEWPEGYRPQSVHVTHDSLYRVAGAEYEYTADDGSRTSVDEGLDWRAEMAATRPNDPMRTDPAPMATTPPDARMVSMTWAYDWLGNMQSWDDDASAFYERSLGDIVNGADLSTPGPRRPGALYVASNLASAPDPAGTLDQGGWLEVRYGEDGNALALTVHGQCSDPALNDIPLACRTTGHAEAIALSCAWSCASEQHYTYAWDEVNRIHEARRYDRDDAGAWSLAVQQRYLYDSANQRTVKSTTFRDEETVTSRVALYVYPGDFERRGLVVGFGQEGPTYQAIAGDTETQYVVGGARIVWRSERDGMGIDRDQRITIGLTDLIQSTTAVLDLATGELVETGSYYANGARETYRASSHGDRVAAEPMGFTGKEADEEVGLTYFGQRYLMSHLGRWASPDPLQTHAVGGGEAINGYHYVAGDALQSRDPLGLNVVSETQTYTPADSGSTSDGVTVGAESAATTGLRDIHGGVLASEREYFGFKMLDDSHATFFVTEEGRAALAAGNLSPAAEAWATAMLDPSREVVLSPVPVFEEGPLEDAYRRPVSMAEIGTNAPRFDSVGPGGARTGFVLREGRGRGDMLGHNPETGAARSHAFYATYRAGETVSAHTASRALGWSDVSRIDRAQAAFELRPSMAATALHEVDVHGIAGMRHGSSDPPTAAATRDRVRRITESAVRNWFTSDDADGLEVARSEAMIRALTSQD